jgi:hypothetical protein
LAGIAGLKETLEDRALPIFMIRRRRSEAVAITRATEGKAQALRNRCARVPHPDRAHRGRLRRRADYPGSGGHRRPGRGSLVALVAVAMVAGVEHDRGRIGEVLRAARSVGEVREADAEGETTAGLLEALEEDSPGVGRAAVPPRTC